MPVVVAAFEFGFGGSWGQSSASALFALFRFVLSGISHLSASQQAGRPYARRVVFADADGKNISCVDQMSEKLPFISILTDPTMGGCRELCLYWRYRDC